MLNKLAPNTHIYLLLLMVLKHVETRMILKMRKLQIEQFERKLHL